MFQNLKFKKIDIIIAPIVLIFFLIIGATYDYYFKQKNFTLVKILYDISAYDRPETFYMNGKTHMNMFIKSFENPYFGNEELKENLLKEFDLTKDDFDYIISSVSWHRIASTWNHKVFLSFSNKPTQKDKILFQKYLYMINELTKIKIHRSYKTLKANLYEIIMAQADIKINEQGEGYLNAKEKLSSNKHLGPLLKESFRYLYLLNEKDVKTYDEMFPNKEEMIVFGITDLSKFSTLRNYLSDQVIYLFSLLIFVLIYMAFILNRK